MTTFPWPAATPPKLKLAGQFPLADQGFDATYLSAAHALHLHGYVGRLRLGTRMIDLQPGDLTLSPAGVASAYDLPAPGRHWCVHFHPAQASDALIALPQHLRLGSAGAYAAERLAMISRLQTRAGEAASGVLARAMAAVALQDLLLWCAARHQASHAPGLEADTLADRVAAIIEARFFEPLTAGRIARDVGSSQHAVARAFRQRFGMTVPRYTLQRRVAHARYLLEATDLPIAAIAERAGVHDAHHFNKLVRRLLGESPTAVRRKARLLA